MVIDFTVKCYEQLKSRILGIEKKLLFALACPNVTSLLLFT